MKYHYEEIPYHSTSRKCTECLQPAQKLRFSFAQNQSVNRSSKQFVCGEHAQEATA